MIGNDIIDLKFGVRSYTLNRREKWLNKIALPAECALLADWPRRLWPDILWSVKESVFKCWSGKHFTRSFAPKHIQLINMDSLKQKEGKGTARWCGESFHVHFSKGEHWLHATATYEQEELCWRLTEFPEASNPAFLSQQLRSVLLSEMQQKRPGHWQITDNGYGLPELQTLSGQITHLSLSHHGRFGAWAFLPPYLNS